MEYIDQVSIQNDESIFSDHASHTNTSHTTSTATPQLSKLSQTKLFSFFTFHPKLPRNSSVSTTQESSIPDTTRIYGAAAFFFPETNTNWSQNCQHQKTTEPSSQFL
jgi:hypothetical protein